ncbi:MAG: 4Fe-4S binding protein [Methanomicrobium sp.]|nr:4Fe-4S binding protein [Methanomicrobium sp.]MBR6010951.1 4Fe-4S binding protein [Methanomicrobium sp.]MBR6447436.1 4Fe-4S binding protein [Methanomicrobium sp.]MBR6497147.1 4Fe-4S binding protein [Methanomicrobium sp.]
MAAIVNTETCTGCETCVDTCPSEAIKMDGGVAVVNPDECVECEACVDECPSEAIHMG